MKVAILFPGQGAQYVGMGQDLYNNYDEVQHLFNKANDILKSDIKALCFEDNEGVINQTAYTQIALFTTNYAIWQAFKIKGIQVDAVLGFSLGEYDAIAASGILTFEDTLKLIEKRGRYMEECANNNPGGMLAVIGLDIEEIKAICDEVREESGEIISVANDNCPGQVTVAGKEHALQLATVLLKERGAKRVVALQVSGAFHTDLMKEAASRLSAEVQNIYFDSPSIPLVSNVTATYIDGEGIKANIGTQITMGVRFRESILRLIEDGVDVFIEIGPKRTLSNLVKKIDKDVKTFNIEDVASLENVIKVLGDELC